MKYKFKTKPYEHQIKALESSWDKKNFALFCEMGTGKSKILLDNISMLYDKGKINAALIVAPKGVYRNWVEQEIPKHVPNHINCRTFHWVAPSSRTKDDKQMLSQLYDETRDPCLTFFVMNVEAFSTGPGMKEAEKFLWAYKCLMAVDESTSIKTPRAQRTVNISSVGRHANYKRIMTGSPVTKSPLDLYSQCGFLDSDLLGHDSFYSFRMRYANMTTINVNGHRVDIVRPNDSYRNLDELSSIVSDFSYRILKEDCLDLPDKVYQMLRLHQITCGHFKADDGTTTAVKNNRMSELLDVLEECEGKVIIWSNYVQDIQNIAKEIGKRFGEGSFCTYYGETKQKHRQSNIDKFQDLESPVRFFIGNPQTGGYGITLTAAKTVVYYSNSYDLEKRLQSEDRAHRIGQTDKVNYVDIICEESVDEKIVAALRQKIDIANEILGEELKEWL
jgi:SNF2 family DNA or RNA helicase